MGKYLHKTALFVIRLNPIVIKKCVYDVRLSGRQKEGIKCGEISLKGNLWRPYLIQSMTDWTIRWWVKEKYINSKNGFERMRYLSNILSLKKTIKSVTCQKIIEYCSFTFNYKPLIETTQVYCVICLISILKYSSFYLENLNHIVDTTCLSEKH